MHTKMIFACLLAIALVGCGKSSSPATGGSPTTQERIKEDLQQAGEKIKTAATQAAAEMKSAYEKAKEGTREAVHTAAEKVADWTATQPATRP